MSNYYGTNNRCDYCGALIWQDADGIWIDEHDSEACPNGVHDIAPEDYDEDAYESDDPSEDFGFMSRNYLLGW